LRRGHWVILDELNLAPSEVLEALNRLLDDNRELYLPEIDETVKPHPHFRLFATQNPSGAYGGRKPLSRAFRNRFVEIHMGDIPSEEMKTILEKRCACPPSHAKALVKVMIALRQRRNVHGVFLGKDGLITPRDLLRWAERGGSSRLALAQEGYMLLAERLRNEEEKSIVREEIEAHLGVGINCDDIYYGENSEAREILETTAHAQNRMTAEKSFSLSSIAPTKSLLRLLTLVLRCVRQKEPVLLVGGKCTCVMSSLEQRASFLFNCGRVSFNDKDTGCGKTTVVQLLRDVLQRDLHIVNCHATTETSDLIGGLRPVRGRGAIALEIRNKFQTFLSLYPDNETLRSLTLPEFLCLPEGGTGNSGIHCLRINSVGGTDLPEDAVPIMMSLTELLWGKLLKYNELPTASDSSVSKRAKKRKLTSGKSLSVDMKRDEQHAPMKELVDEILVLSRRMSSLFEWSDGPLVRAMRSGQMILLDEMSLAEDAVLERLNSVLEPSRTLVLAEKGADSVDGNESDSAVVTGHDDFRIFATMNPGGDFGKRELSPALRSRFTEIWVPPVTDPSDIEMVLGHTLVSAASRCDNEFLKLTILNYVNWFNICVCGKAGNPCADLALSLRDVLAWARFVVDISNSIEDMDVWALYCHGACLMHLDGLGLGTGLSSVDASNTKMLAMSFLLAELPDEDRKACLPAFESDSRLQFVTGRRFGLHPFTIPTGPNPVPETTFAFEAPTTSLNLLRVLRALQISKPILLEGSPGVGKTR
jgi:midasin